MKFGKIAMEGYSTEIYIQNEQVGTLKAGKNKIGVLFFTDSFIGMAGAEKNLFDIVSRLDLGLYKPIIICFQGGSSVDLVKNIGIDIIDLKLKRIYSPVAFLKVIRLISLIRQRDIKILVTYHESSDFLGIILGKLARVPIIISSRRDMGYKLKKRHIVAYKVINRYFNMILTVSDAVKNMIFEKQGVLWHKLLTVHNGVELEKFDKKTVKETIKKSLGLENNWPVVGILAVLRPIKGHTYFLEAASQILKEYHEAYFLIIGWHEDESYYRKLKNFTKQLNIEKNVHYIGGGKNTAEILSIIDVSVMSSINEGFSNAILESMASGIPVVATNSGGTPEAVVDGQTGILVSPCSSDELAKAILKLLRNKKLAVAMGQAGRKRAEELFNMDTMIKAIENLYVSLLQEKLNKEKISFKIKTETIKKLFLRILKLSFSNFLYYTKLFLLIKKNIADNNGIKIFAYHRINNDNFDPLNMHISVENFERQMRFIKAYCKPISLERAVELLQTNHDLEDEMIVVTFDDGYRDNYIYAYPILKKYNIPANIFLSVEAIEKNEILWFDLIISAFKQTNKNYLELNEFGIKRFEFNSFDERMDAAEKIVFFLKKLSKENRQKVIDSVFKKLNLSYQDIKFSNLMVTWDDVKKMQGNIIDFSSHSLSHSILTSLTEEEAELEIKESKRIMEKRIDGKVKFFAYPNGDEGDFNERIISLLKKNNFSAACTLIQGSNNGFSNLYSLKRFCINSEMQSGLLGKFSKSLFALEITGLFKFFKSL